MRHHRTITPEERAKSVAEKSAEDAAREVFRTSYSWRDYWETYNRVFSNTYWESLREFQLAQLAMTC